MSKKKKDMFEEISAKICNTEGREIPEYPNIKLPELMLDFRIKIITQKEKGLTAGMFSMDVMSDHKDLNGSFCGMTGGPFFLGSSKMLSKMIAKAIEAGINQLIQHNQEQKEKEEESPAQETGEKPNGGKPTLH